MKFTLVLTHESLVKVIGEVEADSATALAKKLGCSVEKYVDKTSVELIHPTFGLIHALKPDRAPNITNEQDLANQIDKIRKMSRSDYRRWAFKHHGPMAPTDIFDC